MTRGLCVIREPEERLPYGWSRAAIAFADLRPWPYPRAREPHRPFESLVAEFTRSHQPVVPLPRIRTECLDIEQALVMDTEGRDWIAMSPRRGDAPTASSSSDEVLARSLLRVLGNPSSVLADGHEVVHLAEQRLTREVRLELAPAPAGSRVVIDVLRPAKGQLANLEVRDSNMQWQRLRHDKHQAISKQLIAVRWTALLAAMRAANGADLPDDLWNRLDQILVQLVAIPSDNLATARQRLTYAWRQTDSHSDPNAKSPTLDVAHQYDQLFAQPRVASQMSRLYKLTSMLAGRYLVLVELTHSAAGQPGWIRYVHQQRMSEHQRAELDISREANDKRQVGWKARLRGTFGSVPQTIRVHVPLAVKCAHYRFDMEAPQAYFFWWGGLLKDALVDGLSRNDRRALLVDNPGVRWASGLGHGQRLMVFVDHAPLSLRRPYIGAEVMERPGGSALSAFVLSLLVLVLGLGATALGYLDPSGGADGAAFVVGAAGLVAASASAWISDRGLLGAPALPRMLSVLGSLASGLLALWLLSKNGHPASPNWTQGIDWLAAGCRVFGWAWINLGGGALALSLAIMAGLLWFRVKVADRRHDFVLEGGGNRNEL